MQPTTSALATTHLNAASPRADMCWSSNARDHLRAAGRHRSCPTVCKSCDGPGASACIALLGSMSTFLPACSRTSPRLGNNLPPVFEQDLTRIPSLVHFNSHTVGLQQLLYLPHPF